MSIGIGIGMGIGIEIGIGIGLLVGEPGGAAGAAAPAPPLRSLDFGHLTAEMIPCGVHVLAALRVIFARSKPASASHCSYCCQA